MDISDQSYSGKLFRPKPIVTVDSTQNLFIVATPWGSRDLADEYIEAFVHNFANLVKDPDMTTPHAIYENLTPEQNNLRISMTLANKNIYKKNEAEFSLGMEFLAGVINHNELSWVQTGNPCFIVGRNNQLSVISSSFDMGFEYATNKPLPPLPSQMLGFTKNLDFEVKSLHLQKNDKIIFYSGNAFTLNSIATKDLSSLSHLASAMSHSNPELPFWLGELIR